MDDMTDDHMIIAVINCGCGDDEVTVVLSTVSVQVDAGGAAPRMVGWMGGLLSG